MDWCFSGVMYRITSIFRIDLFIFLEEIKAAN